MIDDYELAQRRRKLYSRYQQCQAYVDNASSGNIDGIQQTTQQSRPGHMVGSRSITPLCSTSSKETRVYQAYLCSTKEDRLLDHYVNSVKKTNSYSSSRHFKQNAEIRLQV